jgi:hypothetical protein
MSVVAEMTLCTQRLTALSVSQDSARTASSAQSSSLLRQWKNKKSRASNPKGFEAFFKTFLLYQPMLIYMPRAEFLSRDLY